MFLVWIEDYLKLTGIDSKIMGSNITKYEYV